MEQGAGFKHITLKQAESEDEIIYAGVAHDVDRSSLAESTEPSGRMPKKRDEKKRTNDASDTGHEEDVVGSLSSPKDDYHETTLEDLQGIKMPIAQKLVILAAIVLIIVAIAYFLGVLR